ncbi:MAG: ACT domain-containing protein [Planctomycetota bacterium]|jgi:hypothetical protein
MTTKAEAVEQISIFLENRSGVVADICAALTEHEINIRALTVLDTIDIGTLRLIVDDAEKAKEALKNAGAAHMAVPVLALPIKNAPGAFAEVAQLMAQHDVNIEYVYATALSGSDRTLGIFRVDDMESALSLSYP